MGVEAEHVFFEGDAGGREEVMEICDLKIWTINGIVACSRVTTPVSLEYSEALMAHSK